MSGDGDVKDPPNPVGDLVERVRAEVAGHASDSDVSAVDAESPDTSAEPHDLLAQAISDLAAHYGRPAVPETLTHGLALIEGRLPLEHAADAAARAGLSCETVEIDALQLSDHDLPVIALMKDGRPEVLWEIRRDRRGRAQQACLSAPGEPGARVAVAASDLAEASSGKLLTFRPAISDDSRGREAVAGAKSNWFFAAFRESRHIYAEAIAATIAINVLALAMPLFSMNVYDRVLPNAAEATLWALAIGVMIAILFDLLIRTLRAHFVDAASRRADVRLAMMIHARLVGARLSLVPSSTGVRANTVREFETLREFFSSATLAAFGDLPFLLLFIGVIWIVAGPLAFVVAAAIPVILLVGFLTQRALHALVLASFQETAQKNAVVVETLVGLEAIKAAGAESWAARNWEKSVAEHVRTGLKIRRVTNLGQHLVHASQTLVQVVVVIAGFYLVAAGQITMGALIAATILSGRALAPLAQAAMLLARFNQARIAYATLTDIVSAPQERIDGATYLSKRDFTGGRHVRAGAIQL